VKTSNLTVGIEGCEQERFTGLSPRLFVRLVLHTGAKGVVYGPVVTHLTDACAQTKHRTCQLLGMHGHSSVPGQRGYGCHAKAESESPTLRSGDMFVSGGLSEKRRSP
jgi:hypothetical protein